ncbi:MAG TPA: hypothetical protein VF503_09605 [Sphingobium sp.]|uniref:hypothetical protein n=1 Tax=Sphingobium sp. TaxID=1912891 RepID=UPI002ED1445F
MRRFASHQIVGALALTLSLGGCGGGSQPGNNALASLDTRLTNGAQDDGSAHKTAANRPTLGSLAEGQRSGGAATKRLADAAGRPVGGCAGRGLHYGDQWVKAMPTGLGLYPGARLTEAAGTDTGRCALRVISFTTADSPDMVVTHYTGQVRKAGFDAERQPCKTEIRLGGTRAKDDAAYLLFARRNERGVTEVDIIASAGPTV